MSLSESLERAATHLTDLADQIRPSEGDPHKLLETLESSRAAELLSWVLVHASESAEELVEAWGEWEKGAEVLLGISDAEMSNRGAPKVARKILRKAHHRLRSRGIEVEAPQKVEKRKLPSVEDPFEAATLSTPDFRGARVGYLADRHPAGGARLFEVRFEEGRGILDFKVYNAGRSKVRGFLRSLSSAQSQRLFDVPRTAFCALVRRASQGQPSDRPLPSGFVEWRGRVFPAALDGEATPGELVRAALEENGEIRFDEDGFEVVVSAIAEGTIGPWPPPTRWVSDWMDTARADALGLEGDARETAIVSWRSLALEALGAESDRTLLARHLEEWAWVRWQMDGLEEAGRFISAADAMGADEEIWNRILGARVDSLFAPFLNELRVGDAAPEVK